LKNVFGHPTSGKQSGATAIFFQIEFERVGSIIGPFVLPAVIQFGRPLDFRFFGNDENGMQRGKNEFGRS